VTDRKLVAARLAVTWLPLLVAIAATSMVLVDFTFNYIDRRYISGVGWVRFFTFDQLYDLALHLSMLAVAFAGGLVFAATARSAFRGSIRAATAS